MALRSLFIFVTLLVTTAWCEAQSPFEQKGITILQTEEVFFGRVSGMNAFEVYVTELVDGVDKAVGKLPKSSPTGGFLVVAVKPGGRSRVWLDLPPGLTAEASNAIQEAVQRVYPMPVKNGVALFAIKISLWGGEVPKGMVPRPAAWEAEGEKVGGPIELGDLVMRVWPD
jgi:hypothetical protein